MLTFSNVDGWRTDARDPESARVGRVILTKVRIQGNARRFLLELNKPGIQ